MASQNTYPPPPPPPPQYQYPPPPYRYRRSIAGPLVLIVIGLVFLLRNFGFRLSASGTSSDTGGPCC